MSSRPGLHWVLLCILLIVLCLAGGASRADVLGQVVVRLAAVGVLVLAVLFGERPAVGQVRPVLLVLLTALALVLVQLVPLPPEIWQRLPGRGVLHGAAVSLGEPAPWRSWAIAPGPAINAALSLLVPFATLALLLGLKGEERRKLPGLLLCLVGASALVAVTQFSGAAVANPLVNQTPGDASGLFANRNHLALWLAQGCLLVPAWAFAAGRRAGWRGPAGIGLILLFLLTILATGSRAGILLGVVAVAALVPLAFRSIRTELGNAPRWVAPAIVAGVLGVAAMLVLLSIVAGRAVSIDRAVAVDVDADIRRRALPTTIDMIGTYFPFGSGAGGFDPLFRLHEPFDLLKPTYFNHAHNDYLEVALDFGLFGIVLLLLGLGWWGWASLKAWRAGPDAGLLPRLGSAMLLQVIVASLFDYPARTPLVMATAVIAAVWLGGRSGKRAASALPGRVERL